MLGFLLAMSVTMALIPPLMQAAGRFNFLDAPGHRKIHASPVPRVGGIAMAAGVLITLALSGDFAQPMPAYLAGVVVLLAFGVWDDRVTLSAMPKLVGQIGAVLLVMLWGDVSISTTTLTERHDLPDWFSAPLTFVFLVGVTNAINLADGLDGLAGGTTLLSLAALAVLALNSDITFVSVVAIVIVGAILGFLRFNTYPARVFMGDGGSQILGFSAGVLAVVLTQDEATPLSSALPLLLLGIPIIDTLMVMTQRVLEGRSPLQADRNHVHHRLLALGFDHHEAVVAIYLLQGGLFVLAWFLRYQSDLTIIGVFVALAATSIVLLHVAHRRGWRWRVVHAAEGMPLSKLGAAIHWLKLPHRLPRWSLVSIASVIALYFTTIASSDFAASPDVRVMSGLIAGLFGAALALRRQALEAGWIEKIALYVAAVIAVYLDREVTTAMETEPAVQWTLMALVAVAVIVRFRLASDRRFRVTPLDVLVVFAAIVIPNLPGAISAERGIGESTAKLLVYFYGLETLLGASARWWRLPSVAALGFLVWVALREAV